MRRVPFTGDELGTAWFGATVSLRWVLIHMVEETAGTPATWTSFASSSTEASVITAQANNRVIARTAAGRRAPAVPVPGTRGRSARSR
jgi:hypothetical protein